MEFINNLTPKMQEAIATIKLYNGKRGSYYKVGNSSQKYDRHFPINYAVNHLPNDAGRITGPEGCLNCYHYGSKDGVFVAYCGDCQDVYNGEREGTGGGTVYDVFENLSYMRGVSISDVGDESDKEDTYDEEEEEEEEEDKDTDNKPYDYQYYDYDNEFDSPVDRETREIRWKRLLLLNRIV